MQPKHTQSKIKEGQKHRAHLSSLIIAGSRWFHGEFDCAQTVKWDTDCKRLNECAAVLAAVWSINKGSDWVISDSTLVSLTVNLPGELETVFQKNSHVVVQIVGESNTFVKFLLQLVKVRVAMFSSLR